MAHPELADVEAAWLEWARPIVRMQQENGDHMSWCNARIRAKSAQYDDLDETLRWPGYVGSSWQIGHGILFVGSVHSDFCGVRDAGYAARRPIVQDMAKANERWRASDAPTETGDSEYLEATRAAYTRLIPHWPRADLFRRLMTGVFNDSAEPFSHAAWTNLAHCRSKPRRGVNEYKLQEVCSGRDGTHPIGDLVALLRPAAIICPIKPMADRHFDFLGRARDPSYQPVFRFFQGTGGATWNGQAPSESTADLIEALR